MALVNSTVTRRARRSATVSDVLLGVGTGTSVVAGVGDRPTPCLTLIRALGKGGDAEVWRATVVGSTGVVAAKVLTNRTAPARQRFAGEIDVMTSCGLRGVMPVIDWNRSPARLVSQPISMVVDYLRQDLPNFHHLMAFASPAAYTKPTPYTDWTLTVQQGDWQDVSAIELTLAGVFLQDTA
jgi:hypothetical protein